MVQIFNRRLSLDINEVGAEPWSLRDAADPEKSLLWEGGPAWERRAPICAPWCGRILGGRFQEAGEGYEAGLHGFLRDLRFALVAQGDGTATFRAGDTAETRARWPWRFSAEITHTLEENRLTTTVSMTNRDERLMPVQIGFHMGLRCPFGGGTAEDYQLRFEQAENARMARCAGGFLTGELRPVFTGQEIVPIDKHMFDEDSILLMGLRSRWVQLEERATGRYLRVSTEGFPAVLLWSAPEVPGFLCIEPWQGMPGWAGGGSTLWERPCTNTLAPGGTFRAAQTLTAGLSVSPVHADQSGSGNDGKGGR